MLIAGTETSAMTMEAAGSFFVANPHVLKKARDEIDVHVEQSRLLDDSDLAKLTYLHCIINETLRLGPTVQLSHHANHQRSARWKVQRPQRHGKGRGEERRGFKFIPFGSGRRRCPGAGLAIRLMALTLGTLIQCFGWEKAEGAETEEKSSITITPQWGFSSYGEHCQNLRRLISLEMVSANRLAMFTNIRQEEVWLLLKQLFQNSRGEFVPVNLKSKLADVSFNIMMRMIAGKRYFGKDAVDEEARQFRDIMSEIVEVHGNSNLGDYLPVFQWLDIQGVAKRMVKLRKKMNEFFQFLIDEHRKTNRNESNLSQDEPSGSNKERKKTLIDVLLSLQETEPVLHSDDTIKETSASTMEWAMALLLNHPEAMKKAVAEIDAHVGQDRLYDVVGEFMDNSLGPRVVGGRDKVHAERFETGEGDEGYKFIPFGAGRRVCPRVNLGRRVMALALGALIQTFEWERVREEDIDLTEGTGLSMPKAKPLQALCRQRQATAKLLSKV
ncbi:cytochrome P450, family 81, subfamily K, polypeptide 1 [Actinidia rufa]|uniref:Cytochrome P450, family 81, subfamily K, polypeptide 1 n=1 Tax=Actinidia rufa TaxID=165716 RepID=A0A7J0FBC1_9ERIC|nr:cytochrome P450, family 81, subfamily K, polypeptide 1 [Actinidia rufa]